MQPVLLAMPVFPGRVSADIMPLWLVGLWPGCLAPGFLSRIHGQGYAVGMKSPNHFGRGLDLSPHCPGLLGCFQSGQQHDLFPAPQAGVPALGYDGWLWLNRFPSPRPFLVKSRSEIPPTRSASWRPWTHTPAYLAGNSRQGAGSSPRALRCGEVTGPASGN